MKECREEESRTAMLVGCGALDRLHRAHVAVFGVGGVGGYVCEALARAGVGKLTIVDNDTVSLSNINRQIIALHSTVGRAKTDVMKERITDINPACKVIAVRKFFLPENAGEFPFEEYTYIVDAIDTVSAKIELALCADRFGIPLISAMGAGNKLDPSGFTVTDLFRTSGCPLARVMRRELRQRGITHLKVVYSEEAATRPAVDTPDDNEIVAEESAGKTKKRSPGSMPYVPGVAGLIIAGEVIKDLIASGKAVE